MLVLVLFYSTIQVRFVYFLSFLFFALFVFLFVWDTEGEQSCRGRMPVGFFGSAWVGSIRTKKADPYADQIVQHNSEDINFHMLKF